MVSENAKTNNHHIKTSQLWSSAPRSVVYIIQSCSWWI